MDVTRSEFQDLVGAYALDACEPEEAAALDAYVAANPDASAEAERLRTAAAWLGATAAVVGAVHLRDGETRRPRVRPLDVAALGPRLAQMALGFGGDELWYARRMDEDRDV